VSDTGAALRRGRDRRRRHARGRAAADPLPAGHGRADGQVAGGHGLFPLHPLPRPLRGGRRARRPRLDARALRRVAGRADRAAT
jgi:hypothetical protein